MKNIFLKKKIVKLIIVFFILTSISIHWSQKPANAGTIALTAIIEISKLIITKAIPMGIKDACKKYLAGNWKWAKYVISPIIDLFPKLESHNSEERESAAKNAIMALNNDEGLRNSIYNRFIEIEKTQKEFAKRISELELSVRITETRISLIEKKQNLIIDRLDSAYTPSMKFRSSFMSILNILNSNQIGHLLDHRIGHQTNVARLPGAYSCHTYDNHPYFPNDLAVICTMTEWEGFGSTFNPYGFDLSAYEILSVEEGLFTFVDCVRNVKNSLPMGWHTENPLLWNYLKDDQYWRLYIKRIKNEDGFQHTYSQSTENKRKIYRISDPELNAFKAYSPNSTQEVWVTYEMIKKPALICSVKIIFLVSDYNKRLTPIRNMR